MMEIKSEINPEKDALLPISGPTNFQKKISKITSNSFRMKTNIYSLVLNEYNRLSKTGETKPMTMDHIENIVDWYYSKRLKFDSWSSNLLIKLKTTEQIVGFDNIKYVRNKEIWDYFKQLEPNQYQARVSNMNYEEFVQQTNIHQLIWEYLEWTEDTLPEHHQVLLEAMTKFYFEQRTVTFRWQECLLRNLQPSVATKSLQTDLAENDEDVLTPNMVEFFDSTCSTVQLAHQRSVSPIDMENTVIKQERIESRESNDSDVVEVPIDENTTEIHVILDSEDIYKENFLNSVNKSENSDDSTCEAIF